ncbi:MFS transporter [Aquabacterium sp. J223]|uniref:MFS transporter n=1 Tax=Aquabacterium sp. J223 TaxID=2898431 RepID=UPI0021ADC8C4|nr:MFS transporter [Aquabacterium sp. J223]UUX97592.1 MFS transporter [Aquabacterium sp. J223]
MPVGVGAAAAPGVPAAGAGMRWALMAGNVAIGCGVMAVPGVLNDLARSLQVSVAVGGQLFAIGAAVTCVSAPLAAAVVSGWDRRRLLVGALLLYAVGHALSFFAGGYGELALLRAVSVLAAAVFTPQAAAAIGHLSAPSERGRHITFVFLGWSIASVIGTPLASLTGELFGWRWAFALVALMSAGVALWLWRAMPAGVQPPALSARAWRGVLVDRRLMATIAVTACGSAGQFTLFAYFAPYAREVLGAGPAQVGLLFFWFGLFAFLGNVLLSRHIDRIGPGRAVTAVMVVMVVGQALWPLAGDVPTALAAAVLLALGSFAYNSGQQARLSHAAPLLAPALMALNTSALYLGQAVGTASGGLILGRFGYAALSPAALVWLVAGLTLSAALVARGRAHR